MNRRSCLFDQLEPISKWSKATIMANALLCISLFQYQVPKLFWIPLAWSCYMPMGNVGLLLGFQAINFGLEHWRGVWTYIHLLLSLTSEALFFFPTTRHKPRILWSAHILFCFWLLLGSWRFGTLPVSTALCVNLGCLLAMNFFVLIWPSEMGYKRLLALPSLLEWFAWFMIKAHTLAAPLSLATPDTCLAKNVNWYEWSSRSIFY